MIRSKSDRLIMENFKILLNDEFDTPFVKSQISVRHVFSRHFCKKAHILYVQGKSYEVVTYKFLPKLIALETKRNSSGPPQKHF